jgi:hypothetical protein
MENINSPRPNIVSSTPRAPFKNVTPKHFEMQNITNKNIVRSLF